MNRYGFGVALLPSLRFVARALLMWAGDARGRYNVNLSFPLSVYSWLCFSTTLATRIEEHGCYIDKRRGHMFLAHKVYTYQAPFEKVLFFMEDEINE